MAEAPFIATVGYVRRLKIGRLAVWCAGRREDGYPCHHQATLEIAGLSDETPLPAVGRRLRCQKCGTRGAVEVRPDWSEVGPRPPDVSKLWLPPPVPRKSD